jgi:hypothetical protein
MRIFWATTFGSAYLPAVAVSTAHGSSGNTKVRDHKTRPLLSKKVAYSSSNALEQLSPTDPRLQCVRGFNGMSENTYGTAVVRCKFNVSEIRSVTTTISEGASASR